MRVAGASAWLLLLALLRAGSAHAATTSGASLLLDHGWEAADGDPTGGLAGLERLPWRPADPISEQAPRDGIRWYRLRVDLASFGGNAVAFAAPSARDADETYFEGVKIGGQGSFPPQVDRANLVFRLYPIPASLSAPPGPKTLLIRVYHGRRDGTVFRTPPLIDRLDRLDLRRSAADQQIMIFLGVSATIAIVFFLFAFHARRAPEYPLFATFSLLLGLYGFTLHSGWGRWPLPREAPFRLGVVCMMLLGACYLPALCGLLRVEAPRRFRLFYAWAFAGTTLALILPDTEWLVVPVAIHPWIVLLAFLDLFLPIGRALAARRSRSPTVLLGHVVFLAGIILTAELAPQPRLPTGPRPGMMCLGAGFVILAATFLWAMSDQLSRFRVAALTDPATRLWNRNALFTELSDRADEVRRSRGVGFGLVLVDLDRFKEWNDKKGHLAGDRLILRVARALQDSSRPGDLVARYGGDEFAVVLEDVDEPSARATAERLRVNVQLALTEEEDGDSVSASLGVALFDPAHHLSQTALFHDADQALYRAKSAGRNRVAVFERRPSSASLRLKRDSGTIGMARRAKDARERPPTEP